MLKMVYNYSGSQTKNRRRTFFWFYRQTSSSRDRERVLTKNNINNEVTHACMCCHVCTWETVFVRKARKHVCKRGRERRLRGVSVVVVLIRFSSNEQAASKPQVSSHNTHHFHTINFHETRVSPETKTRWPKVLCCVCVFLYWRTWHFSTILTSQKTGSQKWWVVLYLVSPGEFVLNCLETPRVDGLTESAPPRPCRTQCVCLSVLCVLAMAYVTPSLLYLQSEKNVKWREREWD